MKPKTFKIDRNIPLPEANVAINTIRAMRIGDSVFFSDRAGANRFYESFYQHTYKTGKGKALNYEGRMRKVEGGWRIWKVGKGM